MTTIPKFGKPRQKKLFRVLRSNGGIINSACEELGMSKCTVYTHRSKNPEFKKELDKAIADGQENWSKSASSSVKQLLQESMETLLEQDKNERDIKEVAVATRRVDEHMGIVGSGGNKITTETKSPDGTITKIVMVGIGVPHINQVNSDEIGSGMEDE